MSDAGRKDFSSKAEEKLTPDSTKSTQQKVSETITDIADRVVRGGQTDDSKSTTQAAFDKAQRASDNAVHGGVTSSIGDKVKNALGLNDN